MQSPAFWTPAHVRGWLSVIHGYSPRAPEAACAFAGVGNIWNPMHHRRKLLSCHFYTKGCEKATHFVSEWHTIHLQGDTSGRLRPPVDLDLPPVDLGLGSVPVQGIWNWEILWRDIRNLDGNQFLDICCQRCNKLFHRCWVTHNRYCIEGSAFKAHILCNTKYKKLSMHKLCIK